MFPQPRSLCGARRQFRRCLVGRVLAVVAMGALLGTATLPNRASASDALKLLNWAYIATPEKLYLAFASGLSAYRAFLRSAAALEAIDTTRHQDQKQPDDPTLRELITEASNRFGVPERWIRAIMLTESAGHIKATSKKGAMGLMQVMPGTYSYLRDRLGFGDNPYAPRDNIFAGSAYLREMFDRYGFPGFIAAYNAGPGRYDDYLAYGRALPDETRRYIVSVGFVLGEDSDGQGFGKMLSADRSGLRFHGVISISPTGEMLTSPTGQPPTVTDRLALHSLLAKAVAPANQ
jgi:hypothetical protein